jgi:hypothetical protein
MGIYEVLKDLAAEMEKDCGKAGGICGDCVQQVQFYIRLIRLAVKMDESRPPIAEPLNIPNYSGIDPDPYRHMRKWHATTLRPGTKAYVLEMREKNPLSGCCERFANNQACSCLEDAE